MDIVPRVALAIVSCRSGLRKLVIHEDDRALLSSSLNGALYPPVVIRRLRSDETAGLANCHFRAAPFLETGSEKYALLN